MTWIFVFFFKFFSPLSLPKVKPLVLFWPFSIDSRFLCPISQVVILRAKIIFTKSSIDFTPVRIRDLDFCFFFKFFSPLSLPKVKPLVLFWPFSIDSRFLCPISQVVILRAKIIFTKSSIDFTPVRIRDLDFCFFFKFFWPLSLPKVKPLVLFWPFSIDSRFLCPISQVVILRAKIIFTKSSIDFTPVRIRDLDFCFFFKFFLTSFIAQGQTTSSLLTFLYRQ